MNRSEIDSFLPSVSVYWSTNCTKVGALCQTKEGRQPGRRTYKSESVKREMSWKVPMCRDSKQGGKARPRGRVTAVSSVNRPAHHNISSKGRGRHKSNQDEILVPSRAEHQAKSILRRRPFITISVCPTWIFSWRVCKGRAWVCSCEPHSEGGHQEPS